METNSNKKSSAHKMNLLEQRPSASLHKEKISAHAIIIMAGILFSTLLFLVKISWINFDWKIPFIPSMIALQIIFLSSALKNRYKKR
jgi:hypothetical protein